MEIDLNKKSNIEASIKIRLNKADYQTQVEKKVKEYAKKAQIKGFRPGKVPVGMIRKLYGKSILVEEINHILSHKLSDYIKENDLKIFGEPLPDKESTQKIDWDNQEDFEFDYNLGLIDDFKLDLDKKVKVKKYKIDVDNKAVEDTIKDIKSRFATEVEGEKSEDDDILEIDVENEEGSIKKEEATLLLSRLDKKEAKKFLGKALGDTITLPIEKLKDASLISSLTGVSPEEAEALKGDFTFTIKGIKRRIDAEINQELFDKVFGADVVKTEAEFIDKVKETISNNYDRESDNFLNLTVRKHLLEKVKIELPEQFLKEWLKLTDSKITDEDLEREFSGYADSLKWNLIQNRLFADNEVKVEHQEIFDRAKSMILEQFGGAVAAESIMDKMDPIVENYLQSEEGKHYQEIHESLKGEKIMELIKDSISVSEKKVSVDEFTKIVQE